MFHFRRLQLFLFRQITLHRSSLVLGFGVVATLLLFVSLLAALLFPNSVFSLVSFYYFVLFVAGLVGTSRSLSELTNPRQSYQFLILPVSLFEKLIGMWLLTSPLFVAAYLAVVHLIFQISLWLAGKEGLFDALYTMDNVRSIVRFMVVQTVFFLGACSFRTHPFLKTILSILVFFFGLGIISTIIFWNTFHGQFSGSFSWDGHFSEQWTTSSLITDVIWYLSGPYFLLVAYFKLKERHA